MKALKIIVIAVLGMIVLAIVAAGTYIEYFGPPTDTMEWNSMPERSQRAVEQIVPPLAGEKYLYFYSLGVVSFEEDGNLITNQRVVSYANEDGEPWIAEARYGEITDISVNQGSNFFDDTVITVHHEDEDDDFELYFSIKRGLDRKIVQYIRDRLQSPELEIDQSPRRVINQRPSAPERD